MEVGFGKRVAADVQGEEVFQKVKVVAGVLPEVWAPATNPWDVTNYGDVEVQFIGTPSTPYQPRRSLDGTNFVNCLAYDEAGNSYTTITAAGIYSFSGLGWLSFTGGAGSTLIRRAAA